MAEFDNAIYNVNKKVSKIFERIKKENEDIFNYLNRYEEEIKTNIIQSKNYNKPFLPSTPLKQVQVPQNEPGITSNDENDNSALNMMNSIGKSKRNASKMAQEKINQQMHVKMNTKLRRPGRNEEPLDNIYDRKLTLTSIKKEKSSGTGLAEKKIDADTNEVNNENMPPPSMKPKRRKKVPKEFESSDDENEFQNSKMQKINVKTEKQSVAEIRQSARLKSRRIDSDVILQENEVDVVVVNSDNESVSNETTKDVINKVNEEKNANNKKSKKKKKKQTEAEDSKKEDVLVIEDKSIYEDALSDADKPKELDKQQTKEKVNETVHLNSTHVVSKNTTLNEKEANQTTTLNSTHVILKNINSVLDETHVIKKEALSLTTEDMKLKMMNCTVILEKIKETEMMETNNEKSPTKEWKKAEVTPPVDNLLTEDESEKDETPEQEETKTIRKGIKTKQMFSPYANSPVKKRVAAFEKLGTESASTTRVTRIKTRNMMNQEKDVNDMKSKFTTPIYHRIISMLPISESRINRPTTDLPVKSASTAKLSRAELQMRREEELKKRLIKEEEQKKILLMKEDEKKKRLLQKEEEAKRKREAMMQAKAEEQRRKREVKQEKAKKLREEKERVKEEKLRQIMTEKNDKFNEEQIKKVDLNAKKLADAEERRRLEEQHRQIKQMEIERQKKAEKAMRKYKSSKLPPLPTDDWEDTDKENGSTRPPYQKPLWARTHNLHPIFLIARNTPQQYFRNLFSSGPTTPDLREIFQTIDERLLRRNSSVYWATPPRYSKLPKY